MLAAIRQRLRELLGLHSIALDSGKPGSSLAEEAEQLMSEYLGSCAPECRSYLENLDAPSEATSLASALPPCVRLQPSALDAARATRVEAAWLHGKQVTHYQALLWLVDAAGGPEMLPILEVRVSSRGHQSRVAIPMPRGATVMLARCIPGHGQYTLASLLDWSPVRLLLVAEKGSPGAIPRPRSHDSSPVDTCDPSATWPIKISYTGNGLTASSLAPDYTIVGNGPRYTLARRGRRYAEIELVMHSHRDAFKTS